MRIGPGRIPMILCICYPFMEGVQVRCSIISAPIEFERYDRHANYDMHFMKLIYIYGGSFQELIAIPLLFQYID